MNRRYTLGLIITVLVLSINQVFIQYWLAQKRYDAQAINLAGKQRMLSRSINLEFYKIRYNGRSTDRVKALYHQWESAHRSLLREDAQAPIKLIEIRNYLKELDQHIDYVKSQIATAVASIGPTQDLESINKNQDEFLGKMDAVVKQMEQESNRKLGFIVRIEIILFIISLFILIIEVLYIYRPISRSMELANTQIQDKNEALRQANDDILRKNEEMEQFTYITAHDLQEPAKTISGFVNLLQSRYQDEFDTKGKKMLQLIKSASTRMQTQIKGLLNYSRLGRDKRRSQVDISKVMDHLKIDLAHQIADTQAEIKYNGLPTVLGNSTEIRLLLQNLISNALKFRKNDQRPKIRVSATESSSHWTFGVRDNGIGINDKHQKKIFSIFQRAHDLEQFEGTGIGLAYCSKIVALHGGDIWVSPNNPDDGSTFHFTIEKKQSDPNRASTPKV